MHCILRNPRHGSGRLLSQTPCDVTEKRHSSWQWHHRLTSVLSRAVFKSAERWQELGHDIQVTVSNGGYQSFPPEPDVQPASNMVQKTPFTSCSLCLMFSSKLSLEWRGESLLGAGFCSAQPKNKDRNFRITLVNLYGKFLMDLRQSSISLGLENWHGQISFKKICQAHSLTCRKMHSHGL